MSQNLINHSLLQLLITISLKNDNLNYLICPHICYQHYFIRKPQLRNHTGIDIIIVDVLQKEYSVALWSLTHVKCKDKIDQFIIISNNLDSERSDECIDFTMMCVFFLCVCVQTLYSITSRNNASISNFGGGLRWKSPWCIINFKIFKKIEKNKKK
ncbi:Uncharacterized protein FWK35_00002221 [Aphis craccivora]|uniref:Uncharacterized protein n=1 Tax=Aphis craccivora TaxID=307492 RepID=A0A6G0ZR76_APHCR|nr:Uncharacterized protein FWK35_00002221 [Aphis craccivora]